MDDKCVKGHLKKLKESADAMETVEEEIITETVETMESAPQIVSVISEAMQCNSPGLEQGGSGQVMMSASIDSAQSTFVESVGPSFTVSAFVDSASSVFTEQAPATCTYMESASSNFIEGNQPAYVESAPQTFNESRLDPMTTVYTDSRLEEAELIINLSSRSRRSMANPTLTQVNTSIAGSENFAHAITDSGGSCSIPISETLVNSSVASIEIQTDGEVVDAVSGNEHDLLLEENTVAIMGQVTASSTGLMSENAESLSGQSEEQVPAEVDPNVIVISVIDDDDQRKRKPAGRGKQTSSSQQKDFVASGSERQAPVPTGLIVNRNSIQGTDQPEITIERKKVHECIVCKAQFKSIIDLFRHRVEHNESMKTTFKCEVTPECNLKFDNPVELDKHRLTHSEQRLFRCSICHDTFSLLHNYKCHLRIHKNEGPYVCNMCYRVFDKKHQFISHMDDHEFATQNPYRHRLQCNVCDKIFSDSAKLKRHNLTHTGTRDYKCDICSKEFFERHKLTRHMLTHNGRRDFQCSVCDKSFSLKHNLTIHMRIHENQRPYHCLVCKRTFIQKIVLQRHLRIHQDYLMEQSQKFSQKFAH